MKRGAGDLRPLPTEFAGMCVPKAPPGKHSGTHAHPSLVFLPDAAAKHAALGFFDCLRAEVEEYDEIGRASCRERV